MADAPHLVTVLMSVYNGEKYLCESIDSILNQTFRNFELLIINDGSIDGTTEILHGYAQQDKRIRLHHQTNQGLITALNKGLDMARGKYIARIDADDVSHSTRLESQVAFLEKNPDVGILGTNVRIVDRDMKVLAPVRKRPLSHYQNSWRLLFDCPLMHSTVMFRKSLIERYGGYSCDMLHAEDFELWARLSAHARVCQIADVLVTLRKHDQNIGGIYGERQKITHLKIACRNIAAYMPFLEERRIQNVAKAISGLMLNDLKEQNTEEVLADMSQIFVRFALKNQIQEEDLDWIKKDFYKKIYAFLVNGGIMPIWRFRAMLSLFSKAGLLDSLLLYFLVKSFAVQYLKKL